MAKFIIHDRETGKLLFMGEAAMLMEALAAACERKPAGDGRKILDDIRPPRMRVKSSDVFDIWDSSGFSAVWVDGRAYFFRGVPSGAGKAPESRIQVWPCNPVETAFERGTADIPPPAFDLLSQFGDKFLSRQVVKKRYYFYSAQRCVMDEQVVGCHLWVWDTHPVAEAVSKQSKRLPRPDYFLFNGYSPFQKLWRTSFPVHVVDAYPFSEKRVGVEYLRAAIGERKAVIIRDKETGQRLFAGECLDLNATLHEAVSRMSPEKANTIAMSGMKLADAAPSYFEIFSSDDYAAVVIQGKPYYYRVTAKKQHGKITGYELCIWAVNPVLSAALRKTDVASVKPDFVLFNAVSAPYNQVSGKYASHLENAEAFNTVHLDARYIRMAVGLWGRQSEALKNGKKENLMIRVHCLLDKIHKRHLSQAEVAMALGIGPESRTVISKAENTGKISKAMEKRCHALLASFKKQKV